MKAEELLLFKEELHDVKVGYYVLIVIGVIPAIFGMWLANVRIETEAYYIAMGLQYEFSMIPQMCVLFFGLISVFILVVNGLTLGRKYRVKLKELKQ